MSVTHMLDTNIVSYALRARPASVLDRLRRLRPRQVCISAITLAELRYGADRSATPERYHRMIDRFVDRVRVLAFDDEAAACYGRLRAELERQGRPIGSLDFLIGAHALRACVALVTNNRREFERIADLTIEDWVEPDA